MILGVVSGAMEGAACTKMEPGKLGRYFVFGAYSSDSPDRTEVTRLAIGVASGHYHAGKLRAAAPDHVLRSLADPFPGLS